MTDAAFVLASYGLVLVSLAAYGLGLVRRLRAARRVQEVVANQRGESPGRAREAAATLPSAPPDEANR